ncbi:MAG TPA: LysR family transcriptional regulator [Oscillospiraceae bacterium]|nr:LysR family transcriptional regulator [Oscillospiraceae bacterium]HPS76035.1 LysR family transcriptional regulator [Oscillospiraceae bacterium]
METNKIKALMAAIGAGSLMRASEALGYTSSGLTHMMNSLERELQVTLLDRSPSGISPTEECKRLMPVFEKIVQDEERLDSELELLRQQKKRLLRLGIFSSTSRNMVPQLIKEYTALHPDTAFQLQVGGKEDMLEWLSTEKVDAAICSRVPGAKFSFVPILHDQYFAVLPTSNPKARNTTMTIDELHDETFILSSFGTDFDFEKDLTSRGMRVKTMAMPVDDPAILAMVSCGLGVSILSRLMIEGYDADVAIIPLEPREERVLGIAMYNNSHPDKYLRDLIALSKKLFGTD